MIKSLELFSRRLYTLNCQVMRVNEWQQINKCCQCQYYNPRFPSTNGSQLETKRNNSTATTKDGDAGHEWSKIISDAEKIVGYPTSLMYLRCLLSDEIADVAMHVRKLIGTKHPLLKTARGLLYGDKHGVQIRGLIVLLISKAAMAKRSTETRESEMISGISARQRALAEITEMIHTANLIHKGVVNMSDVSPTDGSVTDMEFGNKISVLSGDFLLANACTGLAQLQNTQVVESISTAIGDLMEAEFTDISHNALLSDWTRHMYLSSGSLLAKSCQSALALTNQPTELQNQAYKFGLNIAYALQMLSLRDHETNSTDISPHLNQLATDCRLSAKQALDIFNDSHAKSALINITDAVTNNIVDAKIVTNH